MTYRNGSPENAPQPLPAKVRTEGAQYALAFELIFGIDCHWKEFPVTLRLFSVLAWIAMPAAAQDARGQIQGRITDPSGAAVPGVTVRATNSATNIGTPVVSNQTGDYLLPFLLPGTYDVVAEVQGFKKWIRNGVGVQVNDRVTLNIPLEIGSSAESVSVSADAPLVDAASASLGTVVDQRRVAELPLKDGNPIMLSSLSPGVMNLSTGGWSRPFDNASPSAIAIAGNRSGTNEFTLDGAPNTTGAGGNVAYIPPAGVVEEFKIQTATFDASNGFASGAVINVSLKSGTNRLHGSLYEFFQHPKLNANSFFNNLSNQPRAIIRQNRFGGNASGPIVIPKLLDGRNKSFWMYGYEGIKDTFPRETDSATSKNRRCAPGRSASCAPCCAARACATTRSSRS